MGDPVALVVAETRDAARDAADAVFLDIDPLPAVTTAREAVPNPAPRSCTTRRPGNVVLDFHYGDSAAVAAAFAQRRTRDQAALRNSRVVVAAMEPRSALGAVEDGRLVLRVGCQGVFGQRNTLAGIMNLPTSRCAC